MHENTEAEKSALKKEAGYVSRFVIIGVVNTIVGCSIMFGLYNLAGWGYWISSSINYVLTSILSYVLNKKITFRHTGDVAGSLKRFAINIAVCYLLAYGIAKPLTLWALTGFWTAAAAEAAGGTFSLTLCENLAMLVGMVLFTAFNYLGQRFFAFRKQPCDGGRQ